MTRVVVRDLTIPAGRGLGLRVSKGQVLRIHAVEDGQVGDCCFFNANDLREWFHVGQSWALNVVQGTGNGQYLTHFYSKPPRETLMLRAIRDTTKRHFAMSGGRCSAKIFELRDGLSTHHRTCQANVEEALAPFGVTGDHIGDMFNVFMEVDMDPTGFFRFKPSTVKRGDCIELLAEMDILAGISACPSDISPTNSHQLKPLGVQVLE